MKAATSSALRARLTEYLNLGQPVVVTRKGQAVAVLWPVEDSEDLEHLLLANNAEFMQLLDQADRRISETGGIPQEQFWKQVKEESETTANRSRRRTRSA
jgi:prevent-host-death family protein